MANPIVRRGAVALACLAALSSQPALAATTTFPGATSVRFTGGYGYLQACKLPTINPAVDCTDLSAEQPLAPGGPVVASNIGAARAGYLIRGDLSAVDPSGTAAVHWMQFDLDSENYFGANPGAHITAGAWAYLPDQAAIGSGTLGTSYPNYGTYNGIPVPHAYGNGAIFGSVPCNNGSGQPQINNYNGAAIEHFLAPYNASYVPFTNLTAACSPYPVWGPGPQSGSSNLFANYNTYSIRVSVTRLASGVGGCPGPQACRHVRYQVVWSGLVVADSQSYGAFLDTSASNYPPHAVFGLPPAGMNSSGAGWNYASNADKSSWFIASGFTAATGPSGTSWGFTIRNLNVGAGGAVPAGFFQ